MWQYAVPGWGHSAEHVTFSTMVHEMPEQLAFLPLRRMLSVSSLIWHLWMEGLSYRLGH